MTQATQSLPAWLSYTTVTLPQTTQTSVVFLPLTYYGPSIPLDADWTYGGLSSPATSPATSTALSAATTSGASTSTTATPPSSTTSATPSSASLISSSSSPATPSSTSSSTSSAPLHLFLRDTPGAPRPRPHPPPAHRHHHRLRPRRPRPLPPLSLLRHPLLGAPQA
ncbi:hypothetical protein C8F04DRAFT_536454 [Mycena alexandri]|uniref:Uncharacterized protein n=1 Tax=Mycena alexandri TaxID=1745969 RepID=A0AAD6SYD2_9AGAR|nr:hypothetical protein C8F04DRAFT_536454 [Mycena alexandri]